MLKMLDLTSCHVILALRKYKGWTRRLSEAVYLEVDEKLKCIKTLVFNLLFEVWKG